MKEKPLVTATGLEPRTTSPSDFALALSKEFLDIQATIECGFSLERVRDMTRTYSLTFSTFKSVISDF